MLHLSWPRRSRAVVGVTGIVVAAALVASCTSAGTAERETEQSPTTPPQAQSTTVGPQGFSLDVGNVHVSADGAVAPQGTPVTATIAAESLPVNLDNTMTQLGEQVQIILGHDEQPRSPIAISFSLDMGTEAAQAIGRNTEPRVLSRSSDGALDVLNARWDPAGHTVSMITDHLSGFWPFSFDIGALVSSVKSGVSQAFGIRSPKPDCVGKALTIDGRTYSAGAPKNNVAWPCLVNRDGRIALEMHANSEHSWRVRTSPAVSGNAGGVLNAAGVGAIAFYHQAYGNVADRESVLVPGGKTTFTFDPAHPPTDVEMQVAPELYLVAALSFGIDLALSTFGIEAKLLEAMGRADCGASIVEAGSQSNWSDTVSTTVKATLSCLQSVATGAAGVAAGVAVGLLATAPALLVTGVTGVVGEISGDNHVSFPINVTSPTKTPSPSAGPGGGNGQASFPPYVGQWVAHTRKLTINSDGTARMEIFSGYKSGITYSLKFDTSSTPLTAKIVAIKVTGDMNPAKSAKVGDAVTAAIEPGRTGVNVTLPASEKNFAQQVLFCGNNNNDRSSRCGA